MYKLSFKKNEIKKGVILNRLVVKFKQLHIAICFKNIRLLNMIQILDTLCTLLDKYIESIAIRHRCPAI